MMNLLEKLVTNYIKYISNGKVVSQRFTRIMILILIPFWIIAIIFSIVKAKENYDSISKYNKISKFQATSFNNYGSDSNPYGGHEHREFWDRVRNGQTMVFACSTFKYQFWEDVGVESPNCASEPLILAQNISDKQFYRMIQTFSFLWLFLALFLFPRLLSKLFAWINSADSNNPNLKNGESN